MQTGRMKGQAFVGLPDEGVAARALKETNGYILHGKPMVVVSDVNCLAGLCNDQFVAFCKIFKAQRQPMTTAPFTVEDFIDQFWHTENWSNEIYIDLHRTTHKRVGGINKTCYLSSSKGCS